MDQTRRRIRLQSLNDVQVVLVPDVAARRPLLVDPSAPSPAQPAATARPASALPAASDTPLLGFLEREGLREYYEPLYELGAESLGDLADVTDAEFAECGIPQVKGEWLRSQAQAAVRGGGAGGVGSGVGAAGIPEGVPKEDEDDGV